MRLPARIGLITLACRDVERMARLFRDLGWPETPESDEHHRTFQCTNGVVLGLYAASQLRAGVRAAGGRLPRLHDLASTWPRSRRSGRSTRRSRRSMASSCSGEPAEAFWGGGFSWRDPEGNIWDVAWAKDASLDERGGVVFP